MSATVAGWKGGCSVHLSDDEDGVSILTVKLHRWEGVGVDRVIYSGPVNAPGKPATFIKPKKAKT